MEAVKIITSIFGLRTSIVAPDCRYEYAHIFSLTCVSLDIYLDLCSVYVSPSRRGRLCLREIILLLCFVLNSVFP